VHLRNQTRSKKVIVATYTDSEKIPVGAEKEIFCELQVPALPSSEMPLCDFLRIKYVVKFHVHGSQLIVSCMPSVRDICVEIPVTIGHFPVKSEWGKIAAPEALESPASAPIMDCPYGNVVSPSYKEAEFTKAISLKGQSKDFKPLYPTYTWKTEEKSVEISSTQIT